MDKIIVVSEKRAIENSSRKKKYANAIKWGLVTISCITAGVLIYKNKDVIGNWLKQFIGEPKAELTAMPEVVEVAKQIEAGEIIESVATKTIEVSSYCRRLPDGYHASPDKLQQAAEMGIELFENYTLVDEYSYERVA